jgi:hypothetical protein
MKTGTMMQVISDLNEINRKSWTSDSDQITIDKHEHLLYIYVRDNTLTGCIFELDAITKVLHNHGKSFYLSSTKYGKPAVVVAFKEQKN